MHIAIGADEDGFSLKEVVKAHLQAQGHRVDDLGVPTATAGVPYYRTAIAVAQRVSQGQVPRGILCCGTGMGMAILANKLPGVYAAVCETAHAAEQSRAVNNANVLTLGGLFTTPALARTIVDTWLATEFTQGWGAEDQAWLADSLVAIAVLEQSLFTPEESPGP